MSQTITGKGQQYGRKMSMGSGGLESGGLAITMMGKGKTPLHQATGIYNNNISLKR
jgi:hypothetical protein